MSGKSKETNRKYVIYLFLCFIIFYNPRINNLNESKHPSSLFASLFVKVADILSFQIFIEYFLIFRISIFKVIKILKLRFLFILVDHQF